MQHTPGPWVIQHGGMSESDEGFCIFSKFEPGTVAECWPPAADLERRRRLLADAHLIAAAPDMLHALQLVKDWGSHGETDDGESVSYYVESAIAKATGAA